MTQLMIRLFVLSLLAGSCGCQYALAQPGQTPAQVKTCTADATAQNVLTAVAGVLSTGAGVEGTVATQVDPAAGKTLGISVGVTAGLSAASLLVAGYFGKAYTADGCSPTLAPAK